MLLGRVVFICLSLAIIIRSTPAPFEDAVGHLSRVQQEMHHLMPLLSETQSTLHETVSSGFPRRQLKGADGDSCTWDSNGCDISLGATTAMLDKADNPVANYLSRAIDCAHYMRENVCESNGCQWYADSCGVSSEDYNELVSSPCLKSAAHIVTMLGWTLECLDIEQEYSCNVRDHCYWLENFGCVADKWIYYFNVETIDGLPEGFKQLFQKRIDQITKYLNEMYDESNAEDSVNEILYTTLPSFDCPYGYKKIVCKYVEAVSQLQQIEYYCNLKYTTMSECDADEYCEVKTTTTSTCSASSDQIMRFLYKAEEVFNAAIKDPDAQEYEERNLRCQMKRVSYSCTGDCQWDDSLETCFLSGVWLEDHIYNLIGDSTDPVCQYFGLPKSSGCIDRKTEFQCAYDDKCEWSDLVDYCLPGRYYRVELALEASDIACEYRDLVEACEASENRRQCQKVSASDIPMNSHHHDESTATESHSSFSSEEYDSSTYYTYSSEPEYGEKSSSKKSSSYILWVCVIPVALMFLAAFFKLRRLWGIMQSTDETDRNAPYHRIPTENH